jgi:hypothetical protein
METQDLAEPLKEGTIVKILNSGFHRAEIVEYRGPLGPKGARIYGVVAVKKPRLYLEVREDQLEVLQEP